MTTTYVFAGDSITDAGRREDADSLGDGYVRLIANATSERVVNAGISGDRVRDLRRRWDADVLALSPDVVTVLVGINDTWRRYDSGDPTSAELFRVDYDAILSAAAAGGASLILMEPFLVPISAEQRSWRAEDLEEKIAVTRELARRHGARLVPLDGLLAEAARLQGAAAIAEDGVHPTAAGHALIAAAWRETAAMTD